MIGKKINQLATELAPVSTDLTIIGDPTTGVSKKITLAQLGAIFSGAVSFYDNLASFPATGDINVIYCAKDTKKLYLWSGSAYVEVFPSQALLDTYQLRSEKGVSNGYASLDSSGKVPVSQLPSSIMEYKGTWNAATNTPTLANGTGDTGDVYICNVAGTVNFGAGPITFAVGDYVIYSGTIWQRSSGAVGTVTSVAASITGDAIGITGSPVTTSGTLAFAFAGTGAQYIKGDGTLATFPNTIAQATNLIAEVYNSTGATLTKGTIVYINGGQGNLPTVTKAIATGDSTSAQTFGIVQADITNNNNGFVVVSGRLENIATDSFSVGTAIYLSGTTAGAFTSTKPYAPTHLVYIGVIVRSHPTQGVIEVKIQNGYELDELHNVAAQTPTNNDGLFWEASTSLWKNKSIATILGYTPQAQLNGTGFVKASGTTISYDNSTYVTTDTNQTITGIKTFNNITNFNQNIVGGIVKLSQGVLLSKAANIGTDPGHVTLLVQGITGTNYVYFADGDNFLNTQSFAIPTTGTYNYTLQAASGTLAFTSDLTGGTVTSVGLSSATSGVTIGSSPITTSGTITLAIATASGSQQGLLSSTDWTTFNNKQSALTNPVTGTGTTNYLPKFTGTSTIGNSLLIDQGSYVESTANMVISNASTYRGLSITTTTASARPTLSFVNSNYAQYGSYIQDINGRLAFGRMNYDFGGHSEAMTLNASGNLSIGNTNDTYKLDVSGTGRFSGLVISKGSGAYNGGFDADNTGTTGGGIFRVRQNSVASGFISVRGSVLGNTDRNMAYTAEIGLGHYFYVNDGSLALTIASTGAATFSSSVTATSGTFNGTLNTSVGNGLIIGGTGFAFAPSSTRGALQIVGSYDRLISFGTNGNQDAYIYNSASITQIVSTPDLSFVSGATERMRITSGGTLAVGTTNVLGGGGSSGGIGFNVGSSGVIINQSNADFGAYFAKISGYAFGGFLGFYVNGAQVGSISTNGTSTAYNTSSDYRLKTDYKDFSGLDLVSKIKAYDYEWKADKTRSYGVIAHELQSVINYAVTGVKDGKEMQGVDYSKIVPVLIKAIQELNDKIK